MADPKQCPFCGSWPGNDSCPNCSEETPAATVAHLRAENTELRAALEDIAHMDYHFTEALAELKAVVLAVETARDALGDR